MLRPYTAAAPLRATLHCITWAGLGGADVDGPERHAQPPPRAGARVAVRGRTRHEPDPVHLSDDPDHRRNHLGGERGYAVSGPHDQTHPHLRCRPRAVLRDPRPPRRPHGLAVRDREREPLGPLGHWEPATPLWPCHAGRVPGRGAAAPRAVGRARVGGLVRRRIPARGDLGNCGGAVRGPGVRRRADLGGHHAERRIGFHVSVRLLTGHDGATRRRRAVLRNSVHVAAGGRVDGVDQEGRRRDPTGHGGVLLHSSGDGVVMLRYMLLAGIVLAAGVASLRAQDVGLAVGTRAPVVAVEDLDGKSVDLGQYIGRQPVVLEFWATWCPLCKALEPSLKAAHARWGHTVRFVAIGVGVNQSPASIKRHLAQHPLPFPVLYDASGAAGRAYEAPTTSYIVRVNKAGPVTHTRSGDEQDIAAALQRVAGDQATPPPSALRGRSRPPAPSTPAG